VNIKLVLILPITGSVIGGAFSREKAAEMLQRHVWWRVIENTPFSAACRIKFY